VGVNGGRKRVGKREGREKKAGKEKRRKKEKKRRRKGEGKKGFAKCLMSGTQQSFLVCRKNYGGGK
jgi:hypothetical protein